MSEREEWQKGDRVQWLDGRSPHQRGEVVQVAFYVVVIRWETGFESSIAAASPWLTKVGRA